jgi:hypothetical protein
VRRRAHVAHRFDDVAGVCVVGRIPGKKWPS